MVQRVIIAVESDWTVAHVLHVVLLGELVILLGLHVVRLLL